MRNTSYVFSEVKTNRDVSLFRYIYVYIYIYTYIYIQMVCDNRVCMLFVQRDTFCVPASAKAYVICRDSNICDSVMSDLVFLFFT